METIKGIGVIGFRVQLPEILGFNWVIYKDNNGKESGNY